MEKLIMAAAGNKKPKKTSGKHAKHTPSYQNDTNVVVEDDLKKKRK
jgi:hypothetical protein